MYVVDIDMLAPQSFDIIFCVRSLHFLHNVDQVLGNLKRLLTIQGKVQQKRLFVAEIKLGI